MKHNNNSQSVTISLRNAAQNGKQPITSSRRTGEDGTPTVPPLPFSWKLWWKSKYDELSHSLFLAPSLAVIAGIIGAALLTLLDQAITSHDEYSTPNILTTTVESARTVLGTVASATISFAGIAFSVSLLVIQLGASQLSPRVVHTLFKDRFNKNVMALVVGTFTYCLVVLRSVRHALDDEEDSVAIVPNISVAVAVVLGILSILATVAFIDHSAHSMDVSELLERVTRVTIQHIRQNWVVVADARTTVQVEIGHDGMMSSTEVLPEYTTEGDDVLDVTSDNFNLANRDDTSSHVVRFRRSGWVQEIDLQSMILLVPNEGQIQLHTIEGRYAIPGVAVCTITWMDDKFAAPATKNGNNDGEGGSDTSSDGRDSLTERLQELEDRILSCIQIGLSRTMRLDPSYGLRELVDVTLRALSPGVNDPTTAQDGIFHAAAVVIEFLKRNPPPHKYITPNQKGILILGEQQDHDGIVRLAYDEVRKCAASSPTVCVYLMESLRLIRESLRAEGLEFRAPEIERQVRLIEEGCLLTTQVQDDHWFITQARRDRFSDEALTMSHTIPRKDDMNIDSHMEPVAVEEES